MIVYALIYLLGFFTAAVLAAALRYHERKRRAGQYEQHIETISEETKKLEEGTKELQNGAA